MARKAKVESGGVDDTAERFGRRLAYQFGGLPAYFRAAADASWRSAGEGDACPPAPRAWVAQLCDLVGRLTPDDADRPMLERRDRVRRLADELLLEYESRWGGCEHLGTMAHCGEADPELVPPEGEPAFDATWACLRSAAAAFAAGLPAPAWRWVRLGALVADFLSGPLGGPEAVEALPPLQHQLAEMAGGPPLAGMAVDLSVGAYLREGAGGHAGFDRWARERVLAIHEAVEAVGEPAAPRRGVRPAPLRKVSLALALLVDHPEWSDARIAGEAGCDRSTLHRSGSYRAARAAIRGKGLGSRGAAGPGAGTAPRIWKR